MNRGDNTNTNTFSMGDNSQQTMDSTAQTAQTTFTQRTGQTTHFEDSQATGYTAREESTANYTLNFTTDTMDETAQPQSEYRQAPLASSQFYGVTNKQMVKHLTKRLQREVTPPKETTQEMIQRKDRNDLWQFLHNNNISQEEIDEISCEALSQKYHEAPLTCLTPQFISKLTILRQGLLQIDPSQQKRREQIFVNPTQFGILKRHLTESQMDTLVIYHEEEKVQFQNQPPKQNANIFTTKPLPNTPPFSHEDVYFDDRLSGLKISDSESNKSQTDQPGPQINKNPISQAEIDDLQQKFLEQLSQTNPSQPRNEPIENIFKRTSIPQNQPNVKDQIFGPNPNHPSTSRHSKLTEEEEREILQNIETAKRQGKMSEGKQFPQANVTFSQNDYDDMHRQMHEQEKKGLIRQSLYPNQERERRANNLPKPTICPFTLPGQQCPILTNTGQPREPTNMEKLATLKRDHPEIFEEVSKDYFDQKKQQAINQAKPYGSRDPQWFKQNEEQNKTPNTRSSLNATRTPTNVTRTPENRESFETPNTGSGSRKTLSTSGYSTKFQPEFHSSIKSNPWITDDEEENQNKGEQADLSSEASSEMNFTNVLGTTQNFHTPPTSPIKNPRQSHEIPQQAEYQRQQDIPMKPARQDQTYRKQNIPPRRPTEEHFEPPKRSRINEPENNPNSQHPRSAHMKENIMPQMDGNMDYQERGRPRERRRPPNSSTPRNSSPTTIHHNPPFVPGISPIMDQREADKTQYIEFLKKDREMRYNSQFKKVQAPLSDKDWFDIQQVEYQKYQQQKENQATMPVPDYNHQQREQFQRIIQEQSVVLDDLKSQAIDRLEKEKQDLQQKAKFYEERYEMMKISAAKNQSSEQWQPKLRVGTTEEQQLNLQFEKCDTDEASGQILTNVIELIRSMNDQRPRDPNFDHRLLQVERQAKDLTWETEHKKAQLKSTKPIAKLYKTELELPQLARSDDHYSQEVLRMLEARNITHAIPTFNPDIKPDADFTHTWRKILTYTNGSTLTENSYIKILLLVLDGQAYESVYNMVQANNSLSSILKTMTNLFCGKNTVIEDMRKLNKFVRNPLEPIEKTMSRAKLLVEKLKHVNSPISWPDISEKMLISILKQVISTPTRNHLNMEQFKLIKLGVTMDYRAMLDMVDTFEISHSQIPTTSKPIVLSSIDVAPCLPNEPTAPFEPSKGSISQLEQKVQDLEFLIVSSDQASKENPFFKTGLNKRDISLDRKSQGYQHDKDKAKEFANKLQEHRERRREKSREIMDKIRQRSRERSRTRNMEVENNQLSHTLPNTQPPAQQSTQPIQTQQNGYHPQNYQQQAQQNFAYNQHPQQSYQPMPPQMIDPAKTGFNYRARSSDRNQQPQNPMPQIQMRSNSGNRNSSNPQNSNPNYHQLDLLRNNSQTRQWQNQSQGYYPRSNSFNRNYPYGRPQSQERNGYYRGNSFNRNPYYRGNSYNNQYQYPPRSQSQERYYQQRQFNNNYYGRPNSRDRFLRPRSQSPSPRVHFNGQQMNHAYSKENFDARQGQKKKHFSNIHVDDQGETISFNIDKEKYIFCRDCRVVYTDQHTCPTPTKN